MSYGQYQFRRDTAANWTSANPILLSGELGLETDTRYFKIGDGTSHWSSLSYGGLQGTPGSGGYTVGTATINFGAAPGTNITTVTVTGQASIQSTSLVNAYILGSNNTADHNYVEHTIVPIKLSCTTITPTTGFVITASSEYRLTGSFLINWAWQ